MRLKGTQLEKVHIKKSLFFNTNIYATFENNFCVPLELKELTLGITNLTSLNFDIFKNNKLEMVQIID